MRDERQAVQGTTGTGLLASPSCEDTENACEWVEVVSVEDVGVAAFYDLHVPGPENYLAEGMWHHNSGKTDHACVNALIVGTANAPLPYLFVEPTNDLIRTVALATFRKVLDRVEVEHVWHDRDKTLVVGAGSRRFPIMMRSGEEPDRIVGFEAAAAHVDEAALQKEALWKAVVRRVRARLPCRTGTIATRITVRRATC